MNNYLYHYGFRVTRIIDGDTVEGDIDMGFRITKTGVRIRMYNVFAPELKGPTKKSGKAALAKLREILPLKSECIIETHDDKLDSFGRILADIWTPSENDSETWNNANATMAAWIDTQSIT